MTLETRVRPTGVTIVAAMCLIAGACLTVGQLVIGTMIMPKMGGAIINPYAAGFVFLGFAWYLVQAAFLIAIGTGLMLLKNWSRVLLIALIGFVLLTAAFALVNGVVHASVSNLVRPAIIIAIAAWLLTYLLKPHVKKAFGATSL